MSDDANTEKAQCAYKNKDGKCDWWFGESHTHQHIIDSCDTEGHCMVDCYKGLLKKCSHCWMVILHGYEWSNRRIQNRLVLQEYGYDEPV